MQAHDTWLLNTKVKATVACTQHCLFHFLSWEISTLWKNLILLDIQVSPSSSYYEKQWPPFWFSRNLGQSRHGISLTLIWIMLNKQNSGHCTVTNFYLNTNSNTKSKISLFNKSLYLSTNIFFHTTYVTTYSTDFKAFQVNQGNWC